MEKPKAVEQYNYTAMQGNESLAKARAIDEVQSAGRSLAALDHPASFMPRDHLDTRRIDLNFDGRCGRCLVIVGERTCESVKPAR